MNCWKDRHSVLAAERYALLMNYIGEIIFYLVAYSLFEILACQAFILPLFRLGIPVFKKIYDTPFPTHNLEFKTDEIISHSEGRFKLRPKRSVMFLSRIRPLTFIRFPTPLPIRGIGYINDDATIEIKGLLPLGTSLFFLTWLVGWMISVISAAVNDEVNLALFTFIIGVAGFGLIFFISYKIAISRFLDMIYELNIILTEHNST